MPRYEYICKNCNYKEELDLRVSEVKKTIPCPKCNGPFEKQISKGTSFTLKGANWVKNGGSY